MRCVSRFSSFPAERRSKIRVRTRELVPRPPLIQAGESIEGHCSGREAGGCLNLCYAMMRSMSASSRMPSGIPFIVVNEFAERFCFYGINAILALFLVQYMRFGEAQATTWGSLFKSGAYFFP